MTLRDDIRAAQQRSLDRLVEDGWSLVDFEDDWSFMTDRERVAYLNEYDAPLGSRASRVQETALVRCKLVLDMQQLAAMLKREAALTESALRARDLADRAREVSKNARAASNHIFSTLMDTVR